MPRRLLRGIPVGLQPKTGRGERRAQEGFGGGGKGRRLTHSQHGLVKQLTEENEYHASQIEQLAKELEIYKNCAKAPDI